MTVSTKEQITRELARLRMRREDESPEAKAMDTEQVHTRINMLLDQLDRENAKVGSDPWDRYPSPS